MKIDRNTTWMILRDGNKVLFGTKKRDFGKGKLVAPGGKVGENESIEDAAVRETIEEAGVKPTKFEKLGEVIFDNIDYRSIRETHKMHIFVATEWEGEPVGSDEMEPVWLPIREIPYDRLWEDDQHWLSYVLIGEKIQGYFHFNEEMRLDEYWVEPEMNLCIAELNDAHFNLPAAEDTSSFRERFAARAVLIDDDNRVALINAKNRGYYKLPGGGMDEGELIRESLRREVREEAGYEIDILEQLGYTREYRAKFSQINTSYAYLARARKFVGTTLMEDEQEDGFELEWFDTIDDAINAVSAIDTSDMIYQAKFFTARELSILLAARPVIEGLHD